MARLSNDGNASDPSDPPARSRTRRRRLCGAAIGAAAVASIATPVRSDESSVPTGTWEGRLVVAWSVDFDAAAGGGFVYYDGSGPMLFESSAGDLRGKFDYVANGLVIPGPGSPFRDRVAGASISTMGAIRSADDAVRLQDVVGSVQVAGTTVAFGPTTGLLTIDRVGCATVGGRMIVPPEAIGAIDAVGTYSEIRSSWTAVLVTSVAPEAEQRVVERLSQELFELAEVLRLDGAALDRRLLLERVTEAERRLAGLSGEAVCGIDWSTPLWAALVALLEGALENPDGISASDLEFLVSTAVRTAALPSVDGRLESEASAVLGTKLDAAVAAGDRVSIDAVFMAAVALGDRALGQRALDALGAGA